MIKVIDDMLFYADRVRNRAVAAVYKEEQEFKGIHRIKEHDYFASALEVALGFTIKINDSIFRRSPHGQEEPNFIHTDEDMGQYTAILYLNYTHPEDDGTCFWRNRATGLMTGRTTSEAGKILEDWELVNRVPMRFNRAVVFDSRLFHSRALEANFGSDDNSRLIQTIFFSL